MNTAASTDGGARQIGAWARWEFAGLGGAVLAMTALGVSRLGGPSLWHDELAQVFTAKSLWATGVPALPGGQVSASAPLFNVLLGAVIAAAGDAEAVVRAPAVLFGAACVALTYGLARTLLGRPAAMTAAWGLALSPWTVAWAREARFYTLQQALYVALLWTVWRLLDRPQPRWRAVWPALGGAAALYAAGVSTSLHSVLFLSPLGLYAFLRLLEAQRWRSRWFAACAIVLSTGAATIAAYYLFLPKADSLAIFREAKIGVGLADPHRASRFYYLEWLWLNLSLGFFVLAMIGFAAMLRREGWRGIYAALAFWAPVLMLTFFVSYRRPRFMFFAYPFYVAAWAYGAVELTRWLRKGGRSWRHAAAAALAALLLLRLAGSAWQLTGDALETASGAETTLARRHPPWREPCQYVRARLADDVVVITTTALPVLHYVGRVDNWFPSAYIPWEVGEIGIQGLRNHTELARYVEEHPKGYFIAEWWRLEVYGEFEAAGAIDAADLGPWLTAAYRALAADAAWVAGHMNRIEEASRGKITVYAWGVEEAQSDDATP